CVPGAVSPLLLAALALRLYGEGDPSAGPESARGHPCSHGPTLAVCRGAVRFRALRWERRMGTAPLQRQQCPAGTRSAPLDRGAIPRRDQGGGHTAPLLPTTHHLLPARRVPHHGTHR